MKFIIIGSGGCVSLPKPLCQCNICQEARKKGIPYSRHGASLYNEDLHLLIDTPEDIADALNKQNISRIDRIAYSHQDPDHTFGMRVIEQLRLDWLDFSIGNLCTNPITLVATQGVMNDINQIRTKYGSVLDYYVSKHLIRCLTTNQITTSNLTLTLVPVDSDDTVSVFVFDSHGKKLVYAPCDVKPFPESPLFLNADILIIGNTILGDILKNSFVPKEDNLLKKGLFTLKDIQCLKEKYNIAHVIMTHIEECWGKSYDDFLELEKEYDGISFAYDGLVINL